MIFKEEMVGGRERVTTDEEQLLRVTARRLKRDKVVKIARLSGCKNFVSKRERSLHAYSMRSFTFSQWRDLRMAEVCSVTLACIYYAIYTVYQPENNT